MALPPLDAAVPPFPSTPVHMHARTLAAAAAALLSLALPARAQEAGVSTDTTLSAGADSTPRTSLQKGTWAISFIPPGFSGASERAEFGAWEMVGARTNLGLTLAIAVFGVDSESSVSGDASTASTDVTLGINLKRYVAPPREVTPYLMGGAFIGGRFERREGPDDYQETIRGMTSSVVGAVGVEWFPVRRVSLSGQTGFGLRIGRSTTEQVLPDDTEHDVESRLVGFTSFTSALSLQIYF